MRKRPILLSLFLVLLIAVTAASAASVKGWGEQVRGSAGMNAQLTGDPFTVPNGFVGTISFVNCDGDGFWIQGSAHLVFNSASQANGARPKAGTYYVYPNHNLNQGQNRASVTVTVSW